MIKPLYINTLVLLVMALLIGCKTQDKIVTESERRIQNGELRIFKIESSMDATAYMFEHFGQWDERIQSQEKKFKRFYIWRNRDLMDNGKKYTIVTSGVETMQEYFTSFKILDKDGIPCLDSSNESSEELTNFLWNALLNHRGKTKTYLMIKQSL